jgi:cobalt-precorrin 5A hydrolase
MNKIAVCFSPKGEEVIAKLNDKCRERGIKPARGYILGEREHIRDGFIHVMSSVSEWTEGMFIPGNALIFVGAVGIAVRAISNLAKDKLSDCPVIVIDDNAQFVIPILSGHAGGANKLALALAELLGAVPVITTSTDVNDVFSADTFAAENRLGIVNREGIKKVSAKAIESKKITLSIKGFPPKERVDVIVADDTDAEYSLLLKPRQYTVGIGLKRGKEAEELEKFFLETIKSVGIAASDVYAICTIDIKEDEPAILNLREKYRIPVLSFDKEILERTNGDFTSSEFVKSVTGVDNVCERAAVAGAGAGAELILKKTALDGMTVAVAKRECVVHL